MARKRSRQQSSQAQLEEKAADELVDALSEYFERSEADDDDFVPEPIVASDPGTSGDVHRAFSAYRKSLARKKLPPDLNAIRRNLFSASKRGDREAIVHAEMAASWLIKTHDLDSQSPRPVYPSPATYERDGWIYQRLEEGISYQRLSADLKHQAKTHHWSIIGSRNGIKDAAKRYAHYHSLPTVDFR